MGSEGRGGRVRDVEHVLEHLEAEADERAEDEAVERRSHELRSQHDEQHEAGRLGELLVERRRESRGPVVGPRLTHDLGPERQQRRVRLEGHRGKGRGDPTPEEGERAELGRLTLVAVVVVDEQPERGGVEPWQDLISRSDQRGS